MWHKQSFTQFWSQSDAYSRRSSLKLTYIHHPLVVCTHQICCAVAVPIALSQDRLLHGHNRLVNWTPCSRMRESKLKRGHSWHIDGLKQERHNSIAHALELCLSCTNSSIWCMLSGQLSERTHYNASRTWPIPQRHSQPYIDGLVQERCKSSALAMELRFSCINLLILSRLKDWFPRHLWAYTTKSDKNSFQSHLDSNNPIM